jgi:hypothetical protein
MLGFDGGITLDFIGLTLPSPLGTRVVAEIE